MRPIIDGKSVLPFPAPFLPVNRGVAGHRTLVEMDSHQSKWRVTLHSPDIEVQQIHVDATENSLVISSQSEPPIRQVVEPPRCLKPESMRVKRGAEMIRIEVQYREHPCTPLSPSPGGPYRSPEAPCIEHPRCNNHESEEHHIAVT
ncbi:MAG: hypothetical protein WC314_00630 [Vulcanimicrobiota bacterium]